MIFGARTALGIDISGSRINLALLKQGKGGIELVRADSGPVPDGAIKNGNIEDARALAREIRELKAKNRIRANRTALSLVASPAMVQIMDMPGGIPDNVRQFVFDEVKHFAILPMNKIAADYCGIKLSAKRGQRRALVVATDSQKIIDTVKILNKEGLNIRAIEPAVVAYLRACYEKKIDKKFGRNLLFAIVHQNVLTLCLFRNQALDFIRTKPVKADGCESDKYFELLAEEIYEVIQFYELEVLGKRDKWEVTLITDVADIDQRRMELLGTNVEGLQMQVRTPEDAYLDTPVADSNHADNPSAVAVGLAMKLLSAKDAGLSIDLFPPEVAKAESVRKQSWVIANVAAAVLFLMISSVGIFSGKVKEVNENIKQRMHVSKDTKMLLSEQRLLREKIASTSVNLNFINNVLSAGSFLKWGYVLGDIGLATPKAVQITKLSSKGNSKLLLEGRAFSYEAVHLFVDELNTCRHIESASLVGTGKDNRSDDLVKYSIDCSLAEQGG